MRKLSIFSSLVAISLVFAALSNRAAFAQTYPPVNGAVTCTGLGGGVLAPGQTISGSCTVTDPSGVSQAGVTVTGTITSEGGGPQGDASLGSKVHTYVSNAAGMIFWNLNVGSYPGPISLTFAALSGVTSGQSTQLVVLVSSGSNTSSASNPFANAYVVFPSSFYAGIPAAYSPSIAPVSLPAPSSVTIAPSAPAAAPEAPAAAPLAAPIVLPATVAPASIIPPNTGDGGLRDSGAAGSLGLWVVVGVAIGAAVAVSSRKSGVR